MAKTLGAKTVNLDQIQTFPVVVEGYGMVTPNKLPGGFSVDAVIVNDSAERFTAEGFEIVDAILQNISDALNAAVANGGIDPDEAYKNYSNWLEKTEDGTWKVTDLDGFMIGTGLVSRRNKAIPGFDTIDKSAEGDAFGTDTDQAVHFSKSVAQILSDNYEELSALKGFDQEAVDDYIEQVLNSDESALIEEQTNLLNATEILLANNGLNAASFAHYWRDRSGTADQHTSFSVGYNILLAAQLRGATVDYHLVWDMQHGNNEGTSTGTMIDWINEICS